MHPLRTFVEELARIVGARGGDQENVDRARPALARLISEEGWLDDELAAVGTDGYRSYLLHADAGGGFSVSSFVWAPGQGTPVHDHGTWGLVGVLRGTEAVTRYVAGSDGAVLPAGDEAHFGVGAIDTFTPAGGDIHRVRNVEDAPTVSIHVYGGNLPDLVRHAYEPDGSRRPFRATYANRCVPNIWSD